MQQQNMEMEESMENPDMEYLESNQKSGSYAPNNLQADLQGELGQNSKSVTIEYDARSSEKKPQSKKSLKRISPSNVQSVCSMREIIVKNNLQLVQRKSSHQKGGHKSVTSMQSPVKGQSLNVSLTKAPRNQQPSPVGNSPGIEVTQVKEAFLTISPK